jgi:hypothetical protein
MFSSVSSFNSAMRQKLGLFLGFLGWDGVAFLLNVCLLSLNLRQHYNFRESPDRYRPIEAQHVYLLSPQEVAELESADNISPQNPFPAAIKKTNILTHPLPQSVTTPSVSTKPNASPTPQPTPQPAAPHTPTSTLSQGAITPPSNPPALTQTPATILPAVKIAPSTKLSSVNTVTAEPLPLASASTQCRIYGPLTFNRLQQLQSLWKKQNPALPELTWIATQPLHHYSVIFPPLSNAQAEHKHNELIRAGLKFHEFWTEGRSHSVIVVGNFEEEAKADKLIQELHQKGFREAYMMVRTSPNVYWLNHTEAVRHWIDQPSIARAYGVHWKNTHCAPSPITMPLSPRASSTPSPSLPNSAQIIPLPSSQGLKN